MMPLLQSFCIFFAILVVFITIKETTKGGMHNLNEAEVKRELEESKEFYKLIKRESWLRRVASKEARRLEKRLNYLYKLRKKAIKRFGEDSEQTALINRWITEVRRYMTRFTLISDSACCSPTNRFKS